MDLTPNREKTGPARLLDMVPGRSKQAFKTWLSARPKAWRDALTVVAMDGFAGVPAAAILALVMLTGLAAAGYAARAEVRRGRRLPLDEPVADGTVSDLSVSEQTVAAAVRRAGDAVPGVEVRRCRVELGDPRALSDQWAESTDQWAGSTEQGESTERAGSTPSSDHPYPDDPSREDPGPGEERSGAADLVDVPESYRTTRPSRVAVFLQISVSVAVAIPVVSELIRRAVRRAVFEEVGMNVVTVDIDVRDVHDA